MSGGPTHDVPSCLIWDHLAADLCDTFDTLLDLSLSDELGSAGNLKRKSLLDDGQ
jgi:hypothetical protein